MKMKKYVFDKSIYLGLIKKNFNAGDTIELSDTKAVINGEEVTDLRDIMICLKKNYLIPFAGSVYDKVVEIKEEVEDKIKDAVDTVTDTFFGFKVSREDTDAKSIPLSKYTKTTEIDETKAFAEDDTGISEVTGIHVAPAVSKTEISDKTETEGDVTKDVEAAESVLEQDVKVDSKDTTKAKTTAKNAKKATKKETKKPSTKETKKSTKKEAKKSEIVKDMDIKEEKEVGTVRGMKVLKSE